MSICDTCRDPGHCCKYFSLSRYFKFETTRQQVQTHIEQGTTNFDEKMTFELLPFTATTRGAFYGHGDGKVDSVRWNVTCPMLNDEGHCSIYDKRPKLCRTYQPKSDGICIEYEPTTGNIIKYKEEE